MLWLHSCMENSTCTSHNGDGKEPVCIEVTISNLISYGSFIIITE